MELVWHAFEDMVGGEIYVKKIPSMRVIDLARAIAPKARLRFVGIRPGEKLHEQMVSPEDSLHTYEYAEHYKILPAIHNWDTSSERIKNGIKVPEGFEYRSDVNRDWLDEEALRAWIKAHEGRIGTF